MSTRPAVWLGVLVVLAAAAVPAEDRWDEATDLYSQGFREYHADRYAEAAEAFERSDALLPTVRAACNAAAAYLWAGQCDAGRRVMERLIGRTPELRQHEGVRRAVEASTRESGPSPSRQCALASQLLRAIDTAQGERMSDEAMAEVDARRFADLARRRYEAHDYAQAALLYETAFEVHAIADALFNAALAYQRAGRHRQALAALQRFVAEGDESLRENQTVAGLVLQAERAGELGEVDQCVLVSRLRRAISGAHEEPLSANRELASLFRAALRLFESGEERSAAVLFDCCDRVIPHRTARLNAVRSYVAAHDWVATLLAVDRHLAIATEEAADPVVADARRAIEAEPYATDERAAALFGRLLWAIDRVEERSSAGDDRDRR